MAKPVHVAIALRSIAPIGEEASGLLGRAGIYAAQWEIQWGYGLPTDPDSETQHQTLTFRVAIDSKAKQGPWSNPSAVVQEAYEQMEAVLGRLQQQVRNSRPDSA